MSRIGKMELTKRISKMPDRKLDRQGLGALHLPDAELARETWAGRQRLAEKCWEITLSSVGAAVRGPGLLNGGALAALLAFVSSNRELIGQSPSLLRAAIMLFILGALASSLALASYHLAMRAYTCAAEAYTAHFEHPYVKDTADQPNHRRRGDYWTVLTFVLVGAAYCFYVVGALAFANILFKMVGQ
jgi:hypothetical protein